MQRSDEDAPPKRPPCVICGAPTECHPILELHPLCLPHVGDWFDAFGHVEWADKVARTPGWIASKRKTEDE
jgi:hypothetical protein